MKWVTVNLGQNWCYAKYLMMHPTQKLANQIRSQLSTTWCSHSMQTSWRASCAPEPPVITALPDSCITWATSIRVEGVGRGGSQDISPMQCLARTLRTGSQRGRKGLLFWIHDLCPSDCTVCLPFVPCYFEDWVSLRYRTNSFGGESEQW